MQRGATGEGAVATTRSEATGRRTGKRWPYDEADDEPDDDEPDDEPDVGLDEPAEGFGAGLDELGVDEELAAAPPDVFAPERESVR